MTERVQGDVTADSLIELNRQHQKTLIAKKQLKRQPVPTGISRVDPPWVLPDGWAWARLGVVARRMDLENSCRTIRLHHQWIAWLESLHLQHRGFLHSLPGH